MQLEFLERVWGTATGYVQFQQKLKDENGERTGEPKDNKEFLWPEEHDRIGRYLSLREEEDLYFAVPLYRSPNRRSTEVKAVSVVYVDDDGVTGQWKIKPNISVESSPGHFHRYWVVNEQIDPQRMFRIGFEISTFHRHDNEFHADMAEGHKHCGTDPGGWDSTQILRVPGTLNTKPQYGTPWRVTMEDDGGFYTIEELEAAYPQTDAQYVVSLPDDKLPENIPSHLDLLSKLSARADLIDLFTEAPTGIGNRQGWDERLFALENELFRLGFTQLEVYAVASNAACNKFKRGVRNADGTFSPRPNWPLDLWRDVVKASQVYMNREDSWIAPTYDVNSTVDPDALRDSERVYKSEKQAFHVSLLTDEEREFAYAPENRTFIDLYVDWATSKTDAAIVYHIASAFTIMSVIFGEFVHAMPKFGKLRVNLWFLVLGRTTRARKSTSRALMMKIIDAMSGDHFEYDEGSDFTGEGLLARLSEKPNRSSLIHRDEVQGLFKEVNSKTYMTGISDTLTELYDGTVRGSLKKGAGKIDKVETNFILFLMGIVTKVTSVLTLEDFQSGFLARFIHVIGEAPPRTKESEWLDQADANQVLLGDPLYMAIVSRLTDGRNFWLDRAPDRQTVAVRFRPEAWARWNEANWDLAESVREHERAEILEAAADRMGKSAIKAAVLLAVAKKREEVTLSEVLVALRYVEGWADDMVASAEMVSESFWKKDMNELHKIILKAGVISWGDAYAKMDKEPNQFKNIVEGLVMSNMARIRIDEKTHTKYLEAI